MYRGPSCENVSEGDGDGVRAGDMIWGTEGEASGRCACAGPGGAAAPWAIPACAPPPGPPMGAPTGVWAGAPAPGPACAAAGWPVWGNVGIGMTLVRSTGWGAARGGRGWGRGGGEGVGAGGGWG